MELAPARNMSVCSPWLKPMRPADRRTMVAGSTTRQVAIMRVISRAVGGTALGSRFVPPRATTLPSARGVPGNWRHEMS